MKLKHFIAILTIVVLTISCSKSDKDDKEKSSKVEIPELEKECQEGKCVKGQWETGYQRFAINVGDALNLRAKPAVKSRILAQLPITRKITVLYVKPEEETVGGLKGRWAFIRDANNINLKGWLFDYYIGYKYKFKKTVNWNIKNIKVLLGDKIHNYRCSLDGRFVDILKGLDKKEDKIEGEILEFRNVIWFKKDVSDDYTVFFYLREDRSLALQDQYKEGKIYILK